MRKISGLIFLLLIVDSVFSQEKKYQSLFWEISKDNLAKKSYIYGSMHVSDRVSYHLSDAFFKHLLAADMIANESEPSTWHDVMHIDNPNYQRNQDDFYKTFYQESLKKENLQELFFANNFVMNHLLFRNDNFRSDYQEETYLDMFIYQAGRKFNKKNVGLEDVFETIKLVHSVDVEIKPDLEKQQKLTKLLNGKNMGELMKDLYREKNLDKLDSLMILSTPTPMLEVMLYKRNQIMVKSIDSLVQKGSLFAAVGAAHLPGKNGMIELLRSKGYTVKPIFSEYTEVGKTQKKMIDHTFIKPKQVDFTSSDKLISGKLFENIQYHGKTISSPDLTNSSFIQIKRLPLHDYLLEKNKRFDYKSLDSLFFESIQGDIISKKIIKNEKYDLYDIKNKTKTGNEQRHQYYVTPLEILSIDLIGKLDFVSKHELGIFSQLKLNFNENSFKRVTPNNSKFSLEMPSYNVIYGDDEFRSNELIEMYGYDFDSKSYYLAIENKLNDIDYLENTAYELDRIQDEYLIEIDALESKKIISKTEKSQTSEATIKNQKVHLKTLINGDKYYLLATINAEKNKALQFLESIEFKNSSIVETYKNYTDSLGFVSFDVPYRQNQKLFLVKSTKEVPFKTKKSNFFKVYNRTKKINSIDGQNVQLEINKFHKYYSTPNIDTLFANYKKNITKEINKKSNYSDYDDEAEFDLVSAAVDSLAVDDLDDSNYSDFYGAQNIGQIKSSWDKLLGFEKHKNTKKVILNDKKMFDEKKKLHTYEGLISKEGSTQAIKFKYYVKDGITYELKELIDKNESKSNTLFDKIDTSLLTMDSKSSNSMFDDKIDVFINDANSKHDSIRYSALNSLEFLKIKPKDFKKIEQFITTFKFKKEEKSFIPSLYRSIGEIKSDETLTFLEKNYKENTDNSDFQLAILSALTQQKNQKAYRTILNLLDYDLPISSNNSDIGRLFDDFAEDTKNSKVLLPEILKYYSVVDYQSSIVDLINKLNKNNHLEPKHLKKYKSMLLANAKLEYKRNNAWKINQDLSTNSYDTSSFDQSKDLIKYIELLFPFNQENEVKIYLEKCENLDFKEALMAIATLQKKYNGKVDSELMKRLLANPSTSFSAYLLTNDKEKVDLKIPTKTLMESAITIIDNVDHEKTEMTYLFEKKRIFNEKEVIFYFYKLKNKEKDESEFDYRNKGPKLLSIGFVLDESKKPILESFYSGLQKSIEDEDKIEQLASEVLDKSLNPNKPRATFGKKNAYNLGYMY